MSHSAVPHVVIPITEGIDIRSRRTALLLVASGFRVTLVAMAYPWDREVDDTAPFEVVYLDPVETTSTAHQRFILIASNLTVQKARTRMRQRRLGLFGWRQLRDTIVALEPDVIHAMNAKTLKASAEAARILGVPFIYDAHEYWPDHARELFLRLSKSERAFLLESEHDYLPEAAAVITISQYLARKYQESYTLSTEPTVIYNAPLSTIRQALPVHAPVRFVFMGNLQKERNIRMLFEVAAREPDIHLAFQGSGELAPWLHDEIEKRDLSARIEVRPPVPYDELGDSLSAFDVGVICHKPYNDQMEGALPNKFFDSISAGLAVIASDTAVFRAFPAIETFGILFDPYSPDSLREALQFYATHPEVVQQHKKNALAAAQNFTLECQSRQLGLLYQGILAELLDTVDQLDGA